MGRIRGNLNVPLSGLDIIEPLSITENDLQDNIITLRKLRVKNHIYTISRELHIPLHQGYHLVNIATGDVLGYSVSTYRDLANFVVPYNSDLIRVDFSITNPEELPTGTNCIFNFSTSKNGSYVLIQGLNIQGGTSTCNSYYEFPSNYPSYAAGTVLWLSLENVPQETKNPFVTFTFKRNIIE